jgi:hypothetical protein
MIEMHSSPPTMAGLQDIGWHGAVRCIGTTVQPVVVSMKTFVTMAAGFKRMTFFTRNDKQEERVDEECKR